MALPIYRGQRGVLASVRGDALAWRGVFFFPSKGTGRPYTGRPVF